MAVHLVTEQAIAQKRQGKKSLEPESILYKKQLSRDDVTAFVKELGINRSLTRLTLWGTHMGSEGIATVAEVLKMKTTRLAALDLGYNTMGDAGALSIGEMLKVNTSLTTLDLYGNFIGDSGASSLGEAHKINIALTALNYKECHM